MFVSLFLSLIFSLFLFLPHSLHLSISLSLFFLSLFLFFSSSISLFFSLSLFSLFLYISSLFLSLSIVLLSLPISTLEIKSQPWILMTWNCIDSIFSSEASKSKQQQRRFKFWHSKTRENETNRIRAARVRILPKLVQFGHVVHSSPLDAKFTSCMPIKLKPTKNFTCISSGNC